MVRRSDRLAAWAALLAASVVVVTTATLVVGSVRTLAVVLGAVGLVAAAGWIALTRRGARRFPAVVVAALAVTAVVVAIVRADAVVELVVLGVAAVIFTAAAGRAMGALHRPARAGPVRQQASRDGGRMVLLLNPSSGGGKVEQYGLVAEAKRRGIDPVVLEPNGDLRALARDAAQYASVIGMAGGDGSQALVAEVAAELGLAFVCVPAGTRNHLALDLGLERSDVVGALEAFESPIETTIDLAFVNDRVFVNNVSLGVYAEIVRADGYRDARGETTKNLLPELLGPGADPFDLRFVRPDGTTQSSAQLILVSNNPYVLDRFVGAGSRSRLDTGLLGIVAINVASAADAAQLVSLEALGRVTRFRGWTEWSTDRFRVDSDAPVAAGIDGEAVTLSPPLRFRIAPQALRVRLPPAARGLSPAALRPGFSRSSLEELWSIATSHR